MARKRLEKVADARLGPDREAEVREMAEVIETRLIRVDDVASFLWATRSTMRRLVADGILPRPVRHMGGRMLTTALLASPLLSDEAA